MPQTSPPLRLPFYYGWVVVAVAFVTMAVAVTGRTSFSLLYPPILDEFGWGRGETAAAFTIGFVVASGTTPVFGVMMDRLGPRFAIPIGAAVVAIGFFAATYMASPFGLYGTLGVMVVGGSVGMSYIGHSMFLPNWFVRRRGLAIGIAFSGVGVGSIVLMPALQALIVSAGWRAACLAIAAALVAVVVPLNVLFQRYRPEDLGLKPDGDADPAAEGGSRAAKPAVDTIVDRAWAATDWTLPKAMATGRFWWIFIGYVTGLIAWYSVQVHQTRYLLDIGIPAGEAAFALGLVGFFGIGGQIGLGALSDRIGRERGWTIAMSGYAICYLALIALADDPARWLVYLMVASQGLLGYGLASMFGAIAAEIYAGRRFATIFSVLAIGSNIGAGLGPWITGVVYDAAGSYAPAFWLCFAMCFASVGCIWMAAPRKVRLVAGQAAKRAALTEAAASGTVVR